MSSSAIVPAGKRGSHSDFALTETELQDLISYCSDRRTKAMVLLASLGVPVRGIVAFKGREHLYRKEEGIFGYGYFLSLPGIEEIALNPKQWQLLNLYPDGFNITGVTVWRRIKKLILAAGEDGVITFDKDHVPYPAALAFKSTESKLTPTQMVRWCLDRIHHMQQKMPNADFGTAEKCPHKDCEKIRKWLAAHQ